MYVRHLQEYLDKFTEGNAGLYIDRKIIKTGKLEDLSEQELEDKMKKILEDYSQIIDVTPNPKKIEK